MRVTKAPGELGIRHEEIVVVTEKRLREPDEVVGDTGAAGGDGVSMAQGGSFTRKIARPRE